MSKPTPLPLFPTGERVKNVAPHIINARLADVLRPEEILASGLDFDAIHDMRVATRRLRAAVLALDLDDSISAEIKRTQDALGGVRDLQVQLKWLSSPGRQGAEAERLKRQLEAQLPGCEKKLRKELLRWRNRTVDHVAASPATAPRRRKFGGHHDRKQMRRELARVGQLFDEVERSPDPTTIHQLRIKVKKLRYTAELCEGVWPGAVAELLAIVAPLQEQLGDLHDADVRLALIEQFAGPRRSRLASTVEAQRRPLMAQLSAEVAHWQSTRLVRTLRRLFTKEGLSAAPV